MSGSGYSSLISTPSSTVARRASRSPWSPVPRRSATAEAGTQVLARRRQRSLDGAPPLDHGSGRPLEPADEVDPFGLAQPPPHLLRVGSRRPSPGSRYTWAARPVGLTASCASPSRSSEGGQHVPFAAQQLGQGQAAGDRRLRVVGEQDHGMVGEELVEPSRRPRSARRSSRRPWRSTRRWPRARGGASSCRCRAARAAGSRSRRRAPARPRSRPSSRHGCPGSRSTCRAPRGSRRGHRRTARPDPRCGGGTSAGSSRPPASAAPPARPGGGDGHGRSGTGCRRSALRRRRGARTGCRPRG